MARPVRYDAPGAWHHVYNRGIARRPVFETPLDRRVFMACLATAARRGCIEVHAFAVLTTHFHLLVRCPGGGLSTAMQRVTSSFVRYFNRRRRRDGPLFRGRFGSKPVLDGSYRLAVVRYIDANPCEAGLAAHPCDYPFASARAYARSRAHPWLTRVWLEERVRRRYERPTFRPTDYRKWSRARIPDRVRHFVESGAAPSPRGTSTDAIVGPVRARMVRSADIADGSRAFVPLVQLEDVRRVVNELDLHGSDAARPLLCGLGRDLAGATRAMLAAALEVSDSTVRRAIDEHCTRLDADPSYARLVAKVGRRLRTGTSPLQ